MSSRHYKARIRQLIGDIEGLRGLLRKREDEMGNLRASWASEVCLLQYNHKSKIFCKVA